MAEVVKFYPNIKTIDWEFLEIFMRILWAYLPTVDFYKITVTNKCCIEGYTEYFWIAGHFLIFDYNHNIPIQ